VKAIPLQWFTPQERLPREDQRVVIVYAGCTRYHIAEATFGFGTWDFGTWSLRNGGVVIPSAWAAMPGDEVIVHTLEGK
jgi:hypothetical protein